MTEIPRHVQLPNELLKSKQLSPNDILVYLTIKRFMNNESKSCYPSKTTISKLSGLSRNTIIKCIDNLIKNNVINLCINGNKKFYIFNYSDNDGFEMISFDFLDNADLSSSEKAAYCMQQMFMFKNKVTLEGDVKLSNNKLAKELGVSRQWLDRQNKSLEDKGLLILRNSNNEFILPQKIKHFQLTKLDQAFICAINDLNKRVIESNNRINYLEQQVINLTNQIKSMQNKPDITMD